MMVWQCKQICGVRHCGCVSGQRVTRTCCYRRKSPSLLSLLQRLAVSRENDSTVLKRRQLVGEDKTSLSRVQDTSGGKWQGMRFLCIHYKCKSSLAAATCIAAITGWIHLAKQIRDSRYIHTGLYRSWKSDSP